MFFNDIDLINLVVSFISGVVGGSIVVHINKNSIKQTQKAGDNSKQVQRA